MPVLSPDVVLNSPNPYISEVKLIFKCFYWKPTPPFNISYGDLGLIFLGTSIN